ncbi:hypothetical protein Athai_08910 [Actinocatenispora thailandica]|uniref:Cyclic nucleotide-binding domain-containing protein n=1 Tax=Actinocatenispora thailandica TaxID=227318 RepID=A0A7R7DKP9_9ACTN|nr:cyclic nucleotide-binding domain-containing protein [Actinocatenispora thailandica]BCJ33388.1 hypothetical protein Athai_08910 [Actinocatenispora thailandica]
MTAGPVAELATHPFLAGIPDDQLAAVATVTRPLRLPPGSRVFREGEPAARCWLIHTGLVRLDTLVPGRGHVTVETLGAGTVLGWSWLCPPYRWHFGAEATETTHTSEIDGGQLRRLCDDDPDLGYAIMSRFLPVLLDRLQHTRMRLLDLYRSPAWTR